MNKLINYALSLIVTVSAVAVNAQENVVRIPDDKAVIKGKLPNGLTYYIRHNEEPKDLAYFYIAQKVGAIQEEENQRGLAHFLEHMCFNGTKHFPGTSLRTYLETIGVKFGADLNAYTAVDETVYNIDNVPVKTPGAIDSCLWILHDWSNDLTLDPKEIDDERGVITEEWRSRNGATQRLSTQMMPVIMADSKYSDCMPIGSMEIVNSFEPQVLRDYYEKWYRPDLQGIVVVGDIDVNEIEKKIKDIFSDIPAAPADAAERVYYPVPDNKEPIVFIGTDKEYPSTALTVYFKHDATPRDMRNTEQHIINKLLDNQIDYLFHMRTTGITQTENAPFDWCTAKKRNYFLSNTKDALDLSVDTKNYKGAFERGCRAAFDELNRLRRYGFTAEEWARSKADLKSSLESTYKRKDKRYSTQFVNMYVRNFLDNEPMPDIEYEYALYNRILDSLTVDDLNARLQSCFNDRDENMVFVYTGEQNDTVQTPTKENLLGWYSEQKAKDVAPYVDEMAGLTMLPHEPIPGKVMNRVVDKNTGEITLALSNGAIVVLNKNDLEKDRVTMSVMSRGGMSLFPENMYKYGNLLNTSLGVMGLGNLTWSQLQKYNAGVNANIQVGFGDNIESIQGGCSTGDAGRMLEMVHAAFLYPNNDPQAFKSLVGKLSHTTKGSKERPMYAYGQALSFAQYGQNGYTTDLSSDEYLNVDYNLLLDLYKKGFADASDFNFYFIGDIDEKAITPYIEKYIASLPSLEQKEDCKPIKVRRKGVYETYFEHKQETPTANISLIYTAETDYNLKNYLLSGILSQLMDIVYTKTIREEAGAAYSVGCGGETHQYPTSTSDLKVRFSTDPDKKELAIGLVKQGLEDMVANGPSDEDLNKVKEYMSKLLEGNRSVNQYWIFIHNQEWFTGVNLDKGYETTLSEITPKDVQEFASNMVNQNNRIQVVMSSPKNNDETK